MRSERHIRTSLVALLILFTASAIIFSIVVLLTDFGQGRQVSPEQARGLFTVFVYKYLNEVHPQKAALGRVWAIKNVNFPNNHMAVVEATDGQKRSKLEFVYTIEYPKVRVLKIYDITDRDIEDAKLALIRYLGFLHSSDYPNAAALYGGSVARLVPYGPASAPLPELMAGYCEQTSPAKACLSFSVKDAERGVSANTYRLTVKYTLPDGTTFNLANGKEDFEQVVEAVGGDEYKVTTLPFD